TAGARGPAGGPGGASNFGAPVSAAGMIAPPAPGTGAFTPGAPPRPPACGGPPPRRTGIGGAIVGMFGSAPAATSSFIASRSVAYAARQKAVEPAVSARPQLRLPQPL